MATVSYVYTTKNEGYSFDLDTLVGAPNPDTGLLKISHVVDPDSNAVPALAVAATSTAAGDYMAGSVALAAAQLAIESMGDGGLLVGDLAVDGGVTSLTVSGGSVGDVLSITALVPAATLGWTTPADASNWSTFPATQDVDMSTFSLLDASGVFARLVNITGTADAILPDFGTGSLSVDVDPNNYLHYTSQTIGTNIVVTANPTDYAAVGSLLIGNLIDYSPLTIGTVGQVLTSDGTTASWEAHASASDWSTFPATQNVDMGNFDLGIAATGQMVNTINLFAQTGAPTMPTVGGTLAFGAGVGTTAKGAYVGLPALDAINFHQLVTTSGGPAYGSLGSLLIGNAVGLADGDYTPLAIGANGTVLTSDGTTASWEAAASGTVTSVGLTSTGNSLDVTGTPSPITGAGTFNVDLKTTNSPTIGDVLSASSVAPLDLTWVAPAPYFSWVSVAGTSQTMAANTGYFANNAAPTTFTLPATAAVGDVFEIVGPSLWILAPVGGQFVWFGEYGFVAGVTLGATNQGDTVRLVCSDATTPGSEIFRVLGAVGNLSII